jgi:GPH family glycoside/pentoside/hexuronide:cation symporter
VEILNRVTDGITKLTLYWKKPPKGRYMSFKEIVSLSVGGIGIRFIISVVEIMILYTGNVLIGNTIGIAPRPMYIIYVISVIASIPLTAVRAKIIDNSRSKKGKYRPYIFYMAFPTAILGYGFVIMPYDSMTMFWKCVTVLAFNIGFQFFYMFMFDSYTNYVNVLSPNTYERSDVYSIKSITDSLAPSVMNIVVPLVAKAVTGETTIYDLRAYRVLYPVVLVVGLLLSVILYVNTEEKIVQAKTHVIQIKFIDAFRSVAKNKYFWIISLASWIGFLETAFGNILGWMYNYQNVCSAGQYALITTIYGNSSLWAMVFAPALIRVIGKRKLLIYSNIMNIAFITVMYPVVRDAPTNYMIWMFLICLFINGIVTQLTITLTPSINGDIRDYQQYVTGERIDGMFSVVGLIGSVIGLLTSAVLPEIYEKAGLNSEVAASMGYTNVYDVLYNEVYFRSICGVLVLASAIGAAMNVIPYFFYDLTETKQKAMVTVLKIRALFEDYGNNELSDEALVEAIDVIEEAKEFSGREAAEISKAGIKTARKSRDKAALKQAKKSYKNDKLNNEKIEISKFVLKEINKFDSPEGEEEIERAKHIVSLGLKGLPTLSTVSLSQAKALPKITNEEKEIRSDMIERARQEKYSKKVIKKYYPDGVEEFDMTVFEKLFKAEDDNDNELKNTYENYSNAKKSKDRAKKKELKSEIEILKNRKAQIAHETKKAMNYYAIYNRAAKPYVEAKKLLIQKENYSRYEDIKSGYEESKQRAEQERLAAEAKAAREKAEKETYAAKIKADKKAAKSGKQ